MPPTATQPNIASVKAAVRARDGFRCVLCGMTNEQHRGRYGRQLDVHRTSPGSLYSAEPGVCQTLCRRCHGGQPRRRRGQPDLAVQAKPRKMMPLPPWLYDRLKQSARRHNRPATWQLRHIVVQALLQDGTITEDEVRQHDDDADAD